MLEQILSDNSLMVIRRMLLSEIIKLEKREKSFALSYKNYSVNKDCRRVRDKILEIMDLYGIINISRYRNI